MSDFKIAKDDLHHLPELIHRLDKDEESSFLAVVLLSGFLLVCLLVVAVLIVGVSSPRILPNTNSPNREPTSMLVMPATQLQGAQDSEPHCMEARIDLASRS